MINRAAILLLAGLWCLHTMAQQQLASASHEPAWCDVVISQHKLRDIILPEYIIVQQILLEGNDATKQHIIQRELLFSPGDTLQSADIHRLIESSRENLLNTSLFNFVNVSMIFHEAFPLASIRFTFVERWYIWPFPIFEVAERNLLDWLLKPSFVRTNYGAYIVKENFRGRMERLSLLIRAGYRQNYSLSYSIPYINNAQKLGIGLSIGFNQRNEVDYATRDNVQLFYSEADGFALRHFYINSRFMYRSGIHHTHNFLLEYNHFRFADSLLILNPLFSPGSETFAPFFSIGYEFKNDHRDFRPYPLKGYYYDLRIKRQGLGLLRNEKMDITTAETSLRRFWQLSSRWYYAAGVNAKASLGNFQPYYLQQGLGFRGDIVRGYENFVIDGQHFAVLKSNVKFALIPSTVSRIRFIENQKFSLIHYALYVNFFTDFGYVHDRYFFKDNSYSNAFLAGAGIGFDLVTYYDKVFRTEFSLTRHGDFGVHLHLIAPI